MTPRFVVLGLGNMMSMQAWDICMAMAALILLSSVLCCYTDNHCLPAGSCLNDPFSFERWWLLPLQTFVCNVMRNSGWDFPTSHSE